MAKSPTLSIRTAASGVVSLPAAAPAGVELAFEVAAAEDSDSTLEAEDPADEAGAEAAEAAAEEAPVEADEESPDSTTALLPKQSEELPFMTVTWSE